MTTSPFKLSEIEDGIYKLVFDLPDSKLNIISMQTMEELGKIIDELAARKDVKGLIFLSGKKDSFIAGADIKQFKPAFEDPKLGKELIDQGQDVFNRLSKLPFPTVVAINGICVGGGTELSLAFDYRIATDHPKTKIGLPETQLGIIPGWGGTQRLPRLVGLQQGIQMIASGKPVDGKKAYKIGLVDAMAAPEFLEEAALNFIKNPKKHRANSGVMGWLLEKNPLGRSLLFNQARKSILKKTKGHYPAPLTALDVIEKTEGMKLEEGLKIEAETFVENSQEHKEIAKNLISIFFNQEVLKKQGGYSGELPKVKPVENAAVVGAGTMGGGIAFLFAKKMIPVRVKDINWEAVGHATKASWKVFKKLLSKRKMKPNEAIRKFHQISWTLDYSGFEKADFIIESAVENEEIKKKIYREIEENVPKDTIIATNTSSLKISELAEGMKHPERFIGMHFFNPAPLMPLVEIIPGAKTSKATIASTIELAKRLGKTPIVVKDCYSFLVNRIFMMAGNEALELLQEGTSIESMNQASVDVGMPMGFCELFDEVGLDVIYKVNKICVEAYNDDKWKAPDILNKFIEAKLYGKKSGEGFYKYQGKKKSISPKATKILANYDKKDEAPSAEEAQERIVLAMINEAAKCLDENLVEKPEYIDMAMVMGTGFPPFRGGPLAYADSLGLPQVYEKMKAYEKTSPKRLAPCKLIQDMAENNKKFMS